MHFVRNYLLSDTSLGNSDPLHQKLLCGDSDLKRLESIRSLGVAIVIQADF